MSALQKLGFVFAAVLVLVSGYYFYQSQAGTTLGITLTTNPNLERGLVGHWTFDGPDTDWSSTTAEIRDRSGQGNNGDAAGSASYTSVLVGVLGQALDFDGVTAWVNLGNKNVWNLGSTDSTISLWMKSDVIHQDSFPIDRGDGVNAGYGMVLGEPGYRVFYRIYGDGADDVELGPYAVSPERWYHVTVVTTLNPKEAKMYINGTLFQTDVYTGNLLDRSENLSLAADENGNNNFYGSLDDARIYNRALSAEEVKRLYQLGATTKIGQTLDGNTTLERGLVMHYTFDGEDINYGSTTAEIIDKSGNNLYGNWINHATTTVPGVLGQAIDIEQGPQPYSCIRNASSSVISAMRQMTMSVWIRNGSQPYFIGDGNSFWTQTEDIVFRHKFSGDDVYREGIVGTAFLNSTDWKHYVATWDGTASSSGIHLYANGNEITNFNSEVDGTGTPDSMLGVVNIGCNIYNDQAHEGPMDDFRIYNRVLSAEEVKRLYQLGATTKVAQTIDTNPNLERGLVGHWTFDGTDVDWSSTTAEIRDRSGQGNHADADNFTTKNVVAGPIGQAFAFLSQIVEPADNQGDYDACVADTPGNDFDFVDGEKFTIAGWFRPLRNDLNEHYIAKATTWTEGYYISFIGDTLHFFTGNGVDNQASDMQHTFTDTPGTWHHFTAVWGDTYTELYVDGALVDSQYSGLEEATSLATDGDFCIGSRHHGYRPAYSYLDDVRVYNRALSADEAKRLYQLGQ